MKKRIFDWLQAILVLILIMGLAGGVLIWILFRIMIELTQYYCSGLFVLRLHYEFEFRVDKLVIPSFLNTLQ